MSRAKNTALEMQHCVLIRTPPHSSLTTDTHVPRETRLLQSNQSFPFRLKDRKRKKCSKNYLDIGNWTLSSHQIHVKLQHEQHQTSKIQKQEMRRQWAVGHQEENNLQPFRNTAIEEGKLSWNKCCHNKYYIVLWMAGRRTWYYSCYSCMLISSEKQLLLMLIL